MAVRSDLKAWVREAAERQGFHLCGIASAELDERNRQQYLRWLEQGFHGEMAYMKRQQRQDLRSLLPSVRSVICAAMVYNTSHPSSLECDDPAHGWISRYAWGEDYHYVLQEWLERLLEELRAEVGHSFDARIYVDTGPVLERALAWAAGLGWIAKNTCLIHEEVGSWFVVGEILTSLELEPDRPVLDRCGTCTRCIDACPTGAIVQPYVLDATRCISYYTIEVKGMIPEESRPAIGRHVFGCDICQDVCPWNREALVTLLPQFQPRPLAAWEAGSFGNREANPSRACPERPVPSVVEGSRRDREGAVALNPSRDREGAVALNPSRDRKRADKDGASQNDFHPNEASTSAFNPPLDLLGSLTEEEFRQFFRRSPVKRARYRGFLRNVAVAMGNSGLPKFRPALERLAQHPDPIVQEHARWALGRLAEAPSARAKASCSRSTPQGRKGE